MTLELVTYLTFQAVWQDVSLLLAITSAVLLVLNEVLSPKYGKIAIKVDRTKLRRIAFATGVLALASLIILSLMGAL